MKIAISSKGKTLDSKMDLKFGRASFFIVVDSETMEFEALENVQNINATQGAGIQAGKTIVNSGAEVLITQNCGPKAFNVLSSKGIKIATVAEEMTVAEAVEKLKNSELGFIEGANVEGHWV